MIEYIALTLQDVIYDNYSKSEVMEIIEKKHARKYGYFSERIKAKKFIFKACKNKAINLRPASGSSELIIPLSFKDKVNHNGPLFFSYNSFNKKINFMDFFKLEYLNCIKILHYKDYKEIIKDYLCNNLIYPNGNLNIERINSLYHELFEDHFNYLIDITK